MKTDELIAMIAAVAVPVETGAASRRLRYALAWGIPSALLLMATILGVRPDIWQAATVPMFWLKVLFPTAVALVSFGLAQRLSRPGASLGWLPAILAGLFIAIWLLGVFVVGQADVSKRSELVFGQSWATCSFNIALLSVPLFVATVWAIKGLAPTRLRLAGAAAGLLAGGAASTVYALHCPEMAAPFIGIWYVGGMMIPTAIGAILGPRLLRW